MKFGHLILRKIFKFVASCNQMSNFKAKMHHTRFRLGFCPRHRWESLWRSPDLSAGFKGLLLRDGRGRVEVKGGRGVEVRVGNEREGEMRGPQGLVYIPCPKS